VANPAVTRRRKRSARFIEIAQLAGVSASTVDRVLNERGSVSDAARKRVVTAARELAVPRVLPETRHGLIHVDVLLPDSQAPFFKRLNQALQRAMQMLDRRVVVHRMALSAADDDAITTAIAQPRRRRAALIITTHDTAPVREALKSSIARGEQVVTMVTDIPDTGRLHYAGIDNLCAGRTAGYYIGRLARDPGRVLLLCGRMDYRAHADRIGGCRAQIDETFVHLTCDHETQDEDDRCYYAVVNALEQGGLSAIYNSGYGSVGVEAALRKFGAANEVVWVGHEMLDLHRDYIEAGSMDIAIDQDPDGQVIAALQHALHACGIVDTAPRAEPVEFRVFCSTNVRHSPYLIE
jgi:LacI family transcriptional regulator